MCLNHMDLPSLAHTTLPALVLLWPQPFLAPFSCYVAAGKFGALARSSFALCTPTLKLPPRPQLLDDKCIFYSIKTGHPMYRIFRL